MPSPDATAWFLFDNGSVRADSTRSLRRVARALSERVRRPVQAVSLLHSSKVPPEELDGEAARLLEPALAAHFEQHPEGSAYLIPLFFGPSAALTEYVPARLASLSLRYPLARVHVASWMVNPADNDSRLAQALADQVRTTARTRGWSRPNVVLVDHGSPQAGVAAVRDYLGAKLKAELGSEISHLTVASMERRDGAAYDFNEPLLATALRTPPFDTGEVIVALQFLSPGRHAGPGGDIATICAEAEQAKPGLIIQMTEPIAADARLVELLAERLHEAGGC